jgi:hypothetical protein
MVQGHTNIEIGTIRAEEWNIFFLLAAGESWQLPQRGVKPFAKALPIMLSRYVHSRIHADLLLRSTM